MTDLLDHLSHNDVDQRMTALAQLTESHQAPEPQGTNTHVHTNYSFAAFDSPAQAAWEAYQAGVEIFGINDHYTVDGHHEFRQACAIVGIPACFSIEVVAMDREAEAAGDLLNDPGNPGRIYLTGKGVTTANNEQARATLEELRHHQEVRNQAMVKAVANHFKQKIGLPGPSWEDVVSQTPLGNTTERHIARASVWQLRNHAQSQNKDFATLYQTLCGQAPKDDDAGQQNQLRSCLLKSGKPCYVEEAPEAYPDLAGLRQLFLDLGAIPCYPILGNPITAGEEDVSALCDRLDAWGIHALELIPSRNTDDRVAAVLAEAEKRGWPVFDGTEHNTPTMEPLITQWGADPRFRPYFRTSSLVLLGHQSLASNGEVGYVDRQGRRCEDSFARCLAAGKALIGE